MKAVRLHEVRDLRLEEVPVPEIGADEVLVKVIAASMDGTDLELFNGRHVLASKGAVAQGHEYAGEVVEIGPSVTRFRVGDRVTGPFGVHCDKCIYCRRGERGHCARQAVFGVDLGGSWAEYMRAPERVFARLPDEVTFEDGALLCCILPTILRGLDRSPIQYGSSVVVMGLGQVGLTAVMAARDAGAGQVVAVDPIAPRRRLAEEFGAGATIDPSISDAGGEIKELTSGEGADLVIVAASSAVHSGPGSLAATAFEAVVKRGQITFLGLTGEQTANFNRVLSKEIRVVGAKAKMGPEYVERGLALVTSGKWDLETYRRLVTHRLKLEEVPGALSGHGLDTAVKVLVSPGVD